MAPDYKHFVEDLIPQFQRLTDDYLDDFDEHKAFSYLVAELFENVDAEHFSFCDGPKDGGIDFFVQNIQSYSIYQCKCPSLDAVQQGDRVYQVDKAAVSELVAAVHFLLDRDSVPDYKPEILRLKSEYQRDLVTDPEATQLTATLAVLGELTPAAASFFESEQRRLRELHVDLQLITWPKLQRRIYEERGESASTQSQPMFLSYDDYQKDVLARPDYFYMLARAIDLYDALEVHGWNLFDWNVRLKLHKSSINKRIVNSLRRARTRKIFHHLNNGILIVCSSYRNDVRRKRFRLERPQIVNGCQTVTAIRDAYSAMDAREQEEFRSQALVQVKVIISAADYIDDLIISTNDQNPMNPRNLKSNTSEQKGLQASFSLLSPGWFYERKDGEWKSLEQDNGKVRWFRKSDYQVASTRGRPRYRKLENEKLAKSWYAWIGYSEDVLRGGIEYFSDQGNVYPRIFKSRPTEEYWTDFANVPYFQPSDAKLEAGSPSASEFLVAHCIAEYIDAKRVGWQTCKKQAIQSGLERGDLRLNSITGDIDGGEVAQNDFLSRDPGYKIAILLLNMTSVLHELYAFVLARKYGPLDESRSRRILQLPDVRAFVTSAFASDDVLSEVQDGSRTLGPIYGFVRYCVHQYYHANRAEINATIRVKSHFYSRRNVGKFREFLMQTDREIRSFDQPWKLAGRTFIESLPNLPRAETPPRSTHNP